MNVFEGSQKLFNPVFYIQAGFSPLGLKYCTGMVLLNAQLKVIFSIPVTSFFEPSRRLLVVKFIIGDEIKDVGWLCPCIVHMYCV